MTANISIDVHQIKSSGNTVSIYDLVYQDIIELRRFSYGAYAQCKFICEFGHAYESRSSVDHALELISLVKEDSS
jgi:hypothetical protein